MVTLVAPLTVQLKTVLPPLVIVAKETVKLAMAGACLNAVGTALLGKHPVISGIESSRAAIATARPQAPGVDREREPFRNMDFIRLLLLESSRCCHRFARIL